MLMQELREISRFAYIRTPLCMTNMMWELSANKICTVLGLRINLYT